MFFNQINDFQILSLSYELSFQFNCIFFKVNFIILMKPNYFLNFMYHIFSVISKKSFRNPRSHRFYPIFNSKHFTVLYVIFMFVIHFVSDIYLWYEVRL